MPERFKPFTFAIIRRGPYRGGDLAVLVVREEKGFVYYRPVNGKGVGREHFINARSALISPATKGRYCIQVEDTMPRSNGSKWEVSLPDPNTPGLFQEASDPTTRAEALRLAKKWGADSKGRVCIVNEIPSVGVHRGASAEAKEEGRQKNQEEEGRHP